MTVLRLLHVLLRLQHALLRLPPLLPPLMAIGSVTLCPVLHDGVGVVFRGIAASRTSRHSL